MRNDLLASLPTLAALAALGGICSALGISSMVTRVPGDASMALVAASGITHVSSATSLSALHVRTRTDELATLVPA